MGRMCGRNLDICNDSHLAMLAVSAGRRTVDGWYDGRMIGQRASKKASLVRGKRPVGEKD